MAKSTYIRTGVFVACMAGSIAGAIALTPKAMYKLGEAPPIRLEATVPLAFGQWKLDQSAPPQVISPSLQAKLEEIYSDTLTRNYIDNQGNRIMLSMAYGADQSRSLQVHKPEHCYEAFGYALSRQVKKQIDSPIGTIPVMQLVARKDARVEPITYWIRSGDYLIRGWYEQNVARVKSGLKGHLPDGLLVRVSTIDQDSENAYKVQAQFINDMVASLSPEGRKLMLGEQFLAPKQQ